MIEVLKKNYGHFLMEGFGLFLFMVSACFFGGILEHQDSNFNIGIPYPKIRLLIMAAAMGTTALVIFLSPLTSPSGAFINPSVTIMRWRLGQLSLEKLIWYSTFQTFGGLIAVYLMKYLMGVILTAPPVNYVVTIPGKNISDLQAALMETFTAFLMIAMVLFLSDTKFTKAVPYLSALLVGIYVYIAGPVSGFGMNPARTIASAVPANIYTSFWIYMFCPTIGMLAAGEIYVRIKHQKPVVDWKLDGE